MAVQYRDRAEAFDVFQRTRAVLGAPAPLRIDRPQRDMGEQHNWRGFRTALQVVLQPFELVVAETAEAAALEVRDIDEADEMHAAGVERIPATALGAAAVALLVELDLLVDDVVLARYVMHVELGLRDDAIGVIEFLDLRQMRDVAGVDHERWLFRHRVDLVDGFLQRADRIRIGRLVEADMAVADLQERHAGGLGGQRRVDNAERARHAAGDGPEHAGAGPGHAFQDLASADTVPVVVVIAHGKSP